MSGLLVTIPLHLACQLVTPSSFDYENVTVVGSTSRINQTALLPEGYTAFPNVGVAYRVYKNRVQWNMARKLCIADGANLAIVDSFKKLEYLMSMKEKSHGLHTGIHRLFDNVEWTNVKTGKPINFIPWKPDAKLEKGTGDCAAMWNDGSGVGPWNCNNTLEVACEIPLFKEQNINYEQILQKRIDARTINFN